MAKEDLADEFEPSALGERGASLWRAMSPGLAQDAGRLLLLAEVCRMADALDRLDALIGADSDEWARVVWEDEKAKTATLRIESAMSERRSIVGALRLAMRQLSGADGGSDGGGGDILAQLEDIRARRLAGTVVPVGPP